jgi:hypothetical protein
MSFEWIRNVQIAENQVAIALTTSPFGSHIALLFHSAKDGLQLLHLAWHKELKVDNIAELGNECWIAKLTKLPPSASKQFVGICRSISAKKPRINYGINAMLARGSFSANGIYKAPRGSDGLTCATFILEVFRGASISLLDEITWPDTDANRVWGNKVVDALISTGVEASHVEAVRKNVSGLRIRPEEVAAGATLSGPFKMPFQVIDIEATSISAQLKNLCPLTPSFLVMHSPVLQ